VIGPARDTWGALAASVAGGLSMAAAFHPLDLGWLAWVAPVPWLVASCRPGARHVWLLALAFGAAFQLCGLAWIGEVTTAGYVFTAVSMGAHFVPAALVVTAARARLGMPLPLVLPAAWTASEWARGELYLGGFAWLYAGNTQWRWTALAQIADLGGSYLVGIVVLVVASALAELAIARAWPASAHRSRWIWAAVALGLVVASVAYGTWRIATTRLTPGPRIGVVQGNIPQDVKLRQGVSEITDPHVDLTRALARAPERPELIVWPETMLPGCPFSEVGPRDLVRSLAKDAGLPLLVGCTRAERSGPADEPWRHFNSMVLVRPDGAMGPVYDKRRLVPCGETIPLRDVFAWLPSLVRNMVGYVPDVAPGSETVLFPIGAEQLGVVTCNESTFPALARGARARGARILVNATNDGWFKESGELWQVVAISCLRAIENRAAVVRAANTGISCVIDPVGRVTHRIDAGGRVMSVRGTLNERVELDDRVPWALVVGDAVAYAAIGWSLVVALWAWRAGTLLGGRPR